MPKPKSPARRAKPKRAAPTKLTIRPATARDAPTILAMIRGLAAYEQLLHHVKATPARLRKDGFGKRRFFHVLLGFRGRRAVGFALYFFSYSTFLAKPALYLEDLFVLPEERGNGAGLALMRALATAALRNGCGRMDWLVLDWNKPSIAFYKRLGAELHPTWIPTRLNEAALRRVARGK